jgi:hypothetical protein
MDHQLPQGGPAMTPELMIGRRLFASFLLGCLLFNYPILSLFNQATFVFGIPILYLYMFAAWAVLIILIVFTMRSHGKARPAAGRTRNHPGR